MPQVMEERQDSNTVLERKPDLAGFSECNFVFTDISEGKGNRVSVWNLLDFSSKIICIFCCTVF